MAYSAEFEHWFKSRYPLVDVLERGGGSTSYDAVERLLPVWIRLMSGHLIEAVFRQRLQTQAAIFRRLLSDDAAAADSSPPSHVDTVPELLKYYGVVFRPDAMSVAPTVGFLREAAENETPGQGDSNESETARLAHRCCERVVQDWEKYCLFAKEHTIEADRKWRENHDEPEAGRFYDVLQTCTFAEVTLNRAWTAIPDGTRRSEDAHFPTLGVNKGRLSVFRAASNSLSSSSSSSSSSLVTEDEIKHTVTRFLKERCFRVWTRLTLARYWTRTRVWDRFTRPLAWKRFIQDAESLSLDIRRFRELSLDPRQYSVFESLEVADYFRSAATRHLERALGVVKLKAKELLQPSSGSGGVGTLWKTEVSDRLKILKFHIALYGNDTVASLETETAEVLELAFREQYAEWDSRLRRATSQPTLGTVACWLWKQLLAWSREGKEERRKRGVILGWVRNPETYHVLVGTHVPKADPIKKEMQVYLQSELDALDTQRLSPADAMLDWIQRSNVIRTLEDAIINETQTTIALLQEDLCQTIDGWLSLLNESSCTIEQVEREVRSMVIDWTSPSLFQVKTIEPPPSKGGPLGGGPPLPPTLASRCKKTAAYLESRRVALGSWLTSVQKNKKNDDGKLDSLSAEVSELTRRWVSVVHQGVTATGTGLFHSFISDFKHNDIQASPPPPPPPPATTAVVVPSANGFYQQVTSLHDELENQVKSATKESLLAAVTVSTNPFSNLFRGLSSVDPEEVFRGLIRPMLSVDVLSVTSDRKVSTAQMKTESRPLFHTDAEWETYTRVVTDFGKWKHGRGGSAEEGPLGLMLPSPLSVRDMEFLLRPLYQKMESNSDGGGGEKDPTKPASVSLPVIIQEWYRRMTVTWIDLYQKTCMTASTLRLSSALQGLELVVDFQLAIAVLDGMLQPSSRAAMFARAAVRAQKQT